MLRSYIVNERLINHIVEVLFQGGPGDEGAPEPISRRFQWKDPKTGKAPPRPPKEMLPTEQDMRDLDAPGSPAQAPTATPASGSLDDRTGSVPMSGMIGKDELATIDQLLDQYLQMQKTQGPEAARSWFEKYRTAEFEALVNKMADALMESDTEAWSKHFDGIKQSHAEMSKARQAQAPKREYSKGPVPKSKVAAPKRSTS